jgi:hypothetical protein
MINQVIRPNGIIVGLKLIVRSTDAGNVNIGEVWRVTAIADKGDTVHLKCLDVDAFASFTKHSLRQAIKQGQLEVF